MDVEQLLRHFDKQRVTLKDISSLISMTISLARKIDQTLPSDLDKAELDAWLRHYRLIPMINKVKAETSPNRQKESIRQLFLTHAPNLLDAYIYHYEPADL